MIEAFSIAVTDLYSVIWNDNKIFVSELSCLFILVQMAAPIFPLNNNTVTTEAMSYSVWTITIIVYRLLHHKIQHERVQ